MNAAGRVDSSASTPQRHPECPTKQELEHSLQVLETAAANVLGLVATMTPPKKEGPYSYGQYAYGARTVNEIMGEQKERTESTRGE